MPTLENPICQNEPQFESGSDHARRSPIWTSRSKASTMRRRSSLKRLHPSRRPLTRMILGLPRDSQARVFCDPLIPGSDHGSDLFSYDQDAQELPDFFRNREKRPSPHKQAVLIGVGFNGLALFPRPLWPRRDRSAYRVPSTLAPARKSKWRTSSSSSRSALDSIERRMAHPPSLSKTFFSGIRSSILKAQRSGTPKQTCRSPCLASAPSKR